MIMCVHVCLCMCASELAFFGGGGSYELIDV